MISSRGPGGVSPVGQYSARFSRRMKFIVQRAALSVITSRKTRPVDAARPTVAPNALRPIWNIKYDMEPNANHNAIISRGVIINLHAEQYPGTAGFFYIGLLLLPASINAFKPFLCFRQLSVYSALAGSYHLVCRERCSLEISPQRPCKYRTDVFSTRIRFYSSIAARYLYLRPAPPVCVFARGFNLARMLF